VAELFICVPGAYPEAPLVDPAKLGDETINIAVAAIIQVFFISGLLFGFDPNVGDTKKFSLLATLLVRPGRRTERGVTRMRCLRCDEMISSAIDGRANRRKHSAAPIR